jgi:hypothetical protein
MEPLPAPPVDLLGQGSALGQALATPKKKNNTKTK